MNFRSGLSSIVVVVAAACGNVQPALPDAPEVPDGGDIPDGAEIPDGAPPADGPLPPDAAVDAVPAFDVEVGVGGNGSGSVTGGPIDCPGTCSAVVDQGTSFTISAAAAASSNFTGWSGGGCSGTAPCDLTITADTAVDATFTLKQYTLSVTIGGLGDGTVTSMPAGIDCETDCSHDYNHGTMVTLTAAPAASSGFTGWSGGGCTGTAPCTVSMTQARSVTATFALDVYQLQITKTGSTGGGTVTSVPSGINCGTSCTATYSHGTSVTLTAAADGFSTFTGWSGSGCAGTAPCTVAMTQMRTVNATFAAVPPNVMFVTIAQSAAFGANGIVDADALCLARASEAGLVGTGAGRNNTWRAWLSSSTASAASRIGSARGWARVDGRPVFSQIADIAANRFIYPPRIDENGNDVGATKFVYTATNVVGGFEDADPSPGVCRSVAGGPDYTGTVGNIAQGYASGVGVMFTALNDNTVAPPISCATPARIYCMGIDRVAQATPPASPPTSRSAFTSATSWNPAVNPGIEFADQICRNEAIAAGLGSNFLAFLAGNGFSAISRFSTTGPNWVRLSDRVPLVVNPSVFTIQGLQIVDTVPNVTPNGTRLGDIPVWTGQRDPASPGVATSTCANWTTSGTEGYGGRAGDTSMALWFAKDPLAICDVPRRVLCFEQ